MATRASTSTRRRCPVHLSEMMSVGRMVEVLEGLQFNKREEGRLVVDPGITNFLIRATKAAAADHLDAKVRHRGA